MESLDITSVEKYMGVKDILQPIICMVATWQRGKAIED